MVFVAFFQTSLKIFVPTLLVLCFHFLSEIFESFVRSLGVANKKKPLMNGVTKFYGRSECVKKVCIKQIS